MVSGILLNVYLGTKVSKSFAFFWLYISFVLIMAYLKNIGNNSTSIIYHSVTIIVLAIAFILMYVLLSPKLLHMMAMGSTIFFF